jgi:hypothetical protein
LFYELYILIASHPPSCERGLLGNEVKGDDKGQRKRIRKEDVLGIVWRKKIVKYEREVKKC